MLGRLSAVLVRLLFGVAFAGPVSAAQQPVVIGSPNGVLGDVPFTAFTKLNANDAELYAAVTALQSALGGNTFLSKSNNLSDLPSIATARTNLGLGGAALLNVGTVANTVAAGNDGRILGAVQQSQISPALDAAFSSARGALLYRGSGGWVALPPGSAGYLLQTGGTAADPSWTPAPSSGSGVSSSALDNAFGSTQGSILYRGASSWTALTPGTAGYFLQTGGPGANPSWAIQAATTPPVPVSSSASATLPNTSNVDQYATGTITLTAPNAGAGWRTGEILNANAISGTVTLAVPSGATLTGLGVSGNVLSLSPQQRARIVQTGSTTYVALWIERSPILIAATLTSAVSVTGGYPLPQGYASYEISFAGQVTTTGASIGIQFSSDSGSSFKSGTTDYSYQLVYSSGTTLNSGAAQMPYIPLVVNQDAQTTNWASARATLFQGSSTVKPKIDVSASSGIESSNLATRGPIAGNYAVAALIVNAFRLVASTGTVSAGSSIVIRGVPAQ